MRLLKLLIPAAILLAMLSLPSCQAIPFPAGSAATDEFVTKDAVRRMYPPILLSSADSLTYGTACQIVEHNVTFYCENPGSLRPPGFPQSLCVPQRLSVCEQVLGPPSPPEPSDETPIYEPPEQPSEA